MVHFHPFSIIFDCHIWLPKGIRVKKHANSSSSSPSGSAAASVVSLGLVKAARCRALFAHARLAFSPSGCGRHVFSLGESVGQPPVSSKMAGWKIDHVSVMFLIKPAFIVIFFCHVWLPEGTTVYSCEAPADRIPISDCTYECQETGTLWWAEMISLFRWNILTLVNRAAFCPWARTLILCFDRNTL